MAGDKRRTKTEQQANDFDLKLFNLMREAEHLSDQPRLGNKWRAISTALAAIRPDVRAMMNPYDRKETN
jgi:hypothetical protein